MGVTFYNCEECDQCEYEENMGYCTDCNSYICYRCAIYDYKPDSVVSGTDAIFKDGCPSCLTGMEQQANRLMIENEILDLVSTINRAQVQKLLETLCNI